MILVVYHSISRDWGDQKCLSKRHSFSNLPGLVLVAANFNTQEPQGFVKDGAETDAKRG